MNLDIKRKLLVFIGNFIAYYKIVQKLIILFGIMIIFLIGLFFFNESLLNIIISYLKENLLGIIPMIISLFVFAYTIDFKYWSDEKLKREKGIYLFYSIMIDILGLFPFKYNEGKIETEIDDVNIAFDYFMSLHRDPNFIYLPTLNNPDDNLNELVKEMQIFIICSRSELYYVNKTEDEETIEKAQEKIKKDFSEIFNKFLEVAYKNIGYLQFYDENNRLTDYLEIYEGCVINELNKKNSEKE